MAPQDGGTRSILGHKKGNLEDITNCDILREQKKRHFKIRGERKN